MAKQQKLILEYNGGASLFFINENPKYFDICNPDGVLIDIHQLVTSCFEPVNESILTCSCGYPPCAGFDNFKSQITETEIIWSINVGYCIGKTIIHFDKNQYISEVENHLENLILKCGNGILQDHDDDDEFFCNTLTKKDLEMFLSPFINPALTEGRNPLRYKITICPKDNYFCITDNDKKINIKDKLLTFYDTDVFGKSREYSFDARDFLKWQNEKNKTSVKWKKWNSKGLKIAKYLRNNLPLDFDIWYKYQNVENDKLVQISKDIEDVIDSMLNQIPRDINSTF